MFNPAAFSMPLLAGGGGLGAAGGAATAGLGAALGPIGWAGLAMQGFGTAANLIGGNAAADRAQQQMEDQFVSNAAMSFLGPAFAAERDARRARDEVAVAGSQLARQVGARDFREELASGGLAGKYDPFTRAFAGRLSGATTA